MRHVWIALKWLAWTAAAAAGAFVLVFLVSLFIVSCGCGGNTRVTAARFDELRGNPTELRAFLKRMPKGADLHVHLSGAVFAEDIIKWGLDIKNDKGEGLCVRKSDSRIIDPPCDDKSDPLARAKTDQDFYDRLVNAYSMRWYSPSPAVPSGHDQFFAMFSKVGAVTGQVTTKMIAERLSHYAADHVQHTELMIGLFYPSRYPAQYVYAIKGVTDPVHRLQIMEHHNLAGVAKIVSRQIEEWDAAVKKELHCGEQKPDPGCNVSYRYIAQVNRNSDEPAVFVQTAFAAALIRADARVAGLNFVGPEDYRIAREDYRRHMEAIGFLTRKTDTQKEVPVALHAGELWMGLVPPDDLTFHIREAVEVAGAKRIGHGVALAFENRTAQLLDEMRKRRTAVEINLTSNDVILNVRGKDHPLMAYRAAGVPLVLSTDDAGVSRIDLTNEYVRAARDYPLTYRDLKTITHNSIQYSFLGDNAKKEAFKRFDKSFADFERGIAAQHGAFGNTWAWLKSFGRAP